MSSQWAPSVHDFVGEVASVEVRHEATNLAALDLVLAKDILFFVGALTGLASVIQGRALAGQAPEGAVPIESGTTPSATTPERAAGLLRSVNQLGNVNIAVTGAILGITTILSMKATKSARFSAVSRFLP